MTTPPTPDAGEPEVIAGIRAAVFAEAALPTRIEQYKEILDAWDTLTAQLAAAKADGERLDWLQSEHDRFDPVANIAMKFDYDREYNVWANIAGDIRKEIDAARTGAR